MNNININEIVKIEQMPKVFSQLEIIGKYIDEQIKDIDILECTEENKQEVKKRRTEINNTLKLLDDKRKEIKTTLLQPYEVFNEKYEQECKNKLLSASEILKTKVDVIEQEQLKEKQDELELFAKQHFEFNDIDDIVKFEDIGLNITLSASMKSLKDQITAFCEKIVNDLKLIDLEEYKDEILVEYKNNLDFTTSKLNVITRHKMLEELKERQAKQQEIEEKEQEIIEKVDEITVPKEVIEDNELIKVSFTLTGTKEQIKKVKDLIVELGIEYE